jgi:predicted phage terminase large subunit-like protein
MGSLNLLPIGINYEALLDEIKGTDLEDIINEIEDREAKKASTNFLDFTRYTMDDFRENWHHRFVAHKLDQFAKKEIKNLIICEPPRHTKSEMGSRRLPPYILGLFPDSKIISCSYGADLASMMNRDCQRIIDSRKYKKVFPDTFLNTSNVRTDAFGSYQRNSDIFEIVGHKGVYKCAGVGGAITGFGFDYGIIDDPVKNRAEAESETYQEKLWDWYSSTFRTRRQKNASTLIMATRWHKGDLIGRILELAENNPEADQFEVISLPALSEEPLAPYDERTGPDEALWEDEFSKENLLQTKATITLYDWLSLYQQRPSAISGNLISESNFKYCSMAGTGINRTLTLKDNNTDALNKVYLLSQCRIFQTCDPATSISKQADFFSLGTWAQTPNNELVLIDLLHEKMEKPKQIPLMRQQYQNWHPITQWIGSKGLGLPLFQDLRDNGLPVNKIEEESDKVSRFITACDKISVGTVYFLDDLPHKQKYKTQLLDFPNGDHDDMVDITSMAVHVVILRPFEIQQYQTSYVGTSFGASGLRV